MESAVSVPGENDRDGPPPRRDRRRIDEVFGEVLPETTSDERDPSAAPDDTDRWHLENRPPHHDR